MQNLRMIDVNVKDSSTIEIRFNFSLTHSLTTANVSIISDTINVPDSKVLFVKVFRDLLTITCQPLTLLASYSIILKSTTTYPFQSVNGDAKVSEDGVSNRYVIEGPMDESNPIRNYFESYFYDNLYDLEDPETIVSKYIKGLSINIARALYDIRQIKNENYLSFKVVDENKTRGTGPFDRLNEEGAYEILRVGRTPTGNNASQTFSFVSFPKQPVTLQRASISERFLVDSVDNKNIFNINTFILNCSKGPITKVKSIVFTLNTANPIYVYDLSRYGYQILEARYAETYASSYQLITDKQIKVNEEILQDPLFDLRNILKVDVEYEYKNLGISIASESIVVSTILGSGLETLPPIINIFSLKKAPLVDSSNTLYKEAGLTFINTNNPTVTHPAFVVEIPFRLNALPSVPGQYAVDYELGRVYVFGENASNDGTGPFPPVVSYTYRHTYKEKLDYNYDESLRDIVAIPSGSLYLQNGNVTFSYEEVLVEGVDFLQTLHEENLSERIENRLVAANALNTVNSRITNVFRIYNETSGEIYPISRFDGNKVYFRYTNPPSIKTEIGERVTFKKVSNELLFVNSVTTNAGIRYFKSFLKNSFIGSDSEDSIGSSINSSLYFSNTIFTKEKWYDRSATEIVNRNRLNVIGQYSVNYETGIMYVAVSNTQQFDIGSATYNYCEFTSSNDHILSVEDIYFKLNELASKNNKKAYVSFDDTTIVPEKLFYSDEVLLNNNSSFSYSLSSGQVGVNGASFLPGVTNEISFIRGIFEAVDLRNNFNPLNFSSASSFIGNKITVGSLAGNEFTNIQYDGTDYYVILNKELPYISANITYTYSVKKASNSAELWNGSGVVTPGSFVKLVLPGINSPTAGELVNITYTFTINNLSQVVVDYSKGDLFVDYTYLADEIVISYEHGDNVLDFRQSETVAAKDDYYVTYKVGALRDALVKNFGKLIDIPELADLDIGLNRERYRDAAIAALSSFIQGPTVSAIKNIGKTISHVDPEIFESLFEGWSLGNSLLNTEQISTTGEFSLVQAKFGNGVLINKPNQTISFPASSNLRIEEGTFETWIIPEWDGLDNNAKLTFTITKNNSAITPDDVYLGAGEFHPTIVNNTFVLDKLSYVAGKPNKNKDGIFIYYDKDQFSDFSRWYVEVIDGYVSAQSSYKIHIESEGSFFDNKNLSNYSNNELSTFTGTSSLRITINGNAPFDRGVTFLSDFNHYLLDFGKSETTSRLSIFKDASGYLTLRVYDRDKNVSMISSNISSWKKGQTHQVAAAWKLNTKNSQDELHFFVDGLEVPNIIKYNQKLEEYPAQSFRTQNAERYIYAGTSDIVGANDLSITAGSMVVTTSVNINAYVVSPGDLLFIEDANFDPNGYTITSVAAQSVTLNTAMPFTATGLVFSINKKSIVLDLDANNYDNCIVTKLTINQGSSLDGYDGQNKVVSIANVEVSGVTPGYFISFDDKIYEIIKVDGFDIYLNKPLNANYTQETYLIYDPIEIEMPGKRAVRPSYSITQDGYFNAVLNLLNDFYENDLIFIKTLGLKANRIRRRYYLWSDNQENVLRTQLPPPISLDEVDVRKVLVPNLNLNSANTSLIGSDFTYTSANGGLLSNAQSGRSLRATIGGTNIDFTTSVTVTITGMVGMIPTIETISFTDYGNKVFTNKFISISAVEVKGKVTNTSKNYCFFELKEDKSLLIGEDSSAVAEIKYSYVMNQGSSLFNDGYGSVRDDNVLFSHLHIGNTLVITNVIAVGGYYTITGISDDRHSLKIEPTTAGKPLPLDAFSGGEYLILHTTNNRTGLQNGFFTFEYSVLPKTEYFLREGFYEIDYFAYLTIKFDSISSHVYLGSDMFGENQAHAVLDNVIIYNTELSDTRIGEVIPATQISLTKNFNSLSLIEPNSSMLAYINFDSYPFKNVAPIYKNYAQEGFESSIVVNDKFKNSTVFNGHPLEINNDGILDTKKEATIEFWMEPLLDTANDPTERFYFDAYGAVTEELVSSNNVTVKLDHSANKIISVRLKSDPTLDYFVGGKLEIDISNAITEQLVSSTSTSVKVSKNILQVISVKLIGDLSNTDYFVDGSINPDHKTIHLGSVLPLNNANVIVTYKTQEFKKNNSQVIRLNRKLPAHNTRVIVTYMPKGLQGDRVSIFKDKFGYINFGISASGMDYVLRAPTYWGKNTWHRIKASYKVNSQADEMRLFVDGYEYQEFTYGTNLLIGTGGTVFGVSSPGDGYYVNPSIKFKDPINKLVVGTKADHTSPAYVLMDNLKISNISRPIYAPYGESIDVHYSSNLDIVYPVVRDLYTTYIMDFDNISELNNDFATLQNRKTGLFDFSINIFDSFGIINDNEKVKEILEKLIRTLKPANSKAFIKYS